VINVSITPRTSKSWVSFAASVSRNAMGSPFFRKTIIHREGTKGATMVWMGVVLRALRVFVVPCGR
jgi:hypothetical protein